MFCSLLKMLVFQLYIILVKMCTLSIMHVISDALVASPRDNLLCELVFMRSNAFINILSFEKTNFMIANVCHN